MASNQEELAASLSQDEIPIKLRCASCSRLAVNAFRLPCCDQNICDSCQEALPDSCPVCMHSPLSATDCNPSKSLRLTVRAFLKSEEKKRAKEKTESATPAPQASTTSIAPQSSPPLASVNTPVASIETPLDVEATQTVGEQTTTTATADDVGAEPEPPKDRRSASSSVEITLEAPEDALASQSSHKGFGEPSSRDPPSRPPSRAGNGGASSAQMNQPQGLGNQFQQLNQVGNPSGWNFGGMNQMGGMGRMNQLPMQNNMNAMNYPNFPMMGMSGMGMNFMPMASGMMPGFNGQGMGMNAMNGMQNMNGFGMGMGFGGNFGNFGVNSSSMGMNGGFGGNFGANAGYYPSSGYNQQMHHQSQFNQMHQTRYNMHHSNRQTRFSGRGSFRDRGRGRYHQHAQFSQGPNHFQGTSTSFQSWQDPRATEFRQLTETDEGTTQDESQPHDDVVTHNTQSQDDNSPNNEQHEAVQNAVKPAEVEEPNDATPRKGEDQPYADDHDTMTSLRGNDETAVEASEPQPIATFDPSSQDHVADPNVGNSSDHNILGAALNAPRGPAAQFTERGGPTQGFGRGFGRGMYEGRGRFRGRGYGRFNQHLEHPQEYYGEGGSAVPTDTIDNEVPGAPTGPKAMRAGLSNTGIRGRGGFRIAHRGGRPYPYQNPASGPNASEMGDWVDSQGERQASRSRSRSRSPARSPARSTSGQQGRYRSRSPGQYDSGVAEEFDRYGEQQNLEPGDYKEYPQENEPGFQSRDRSVESRTHHSSRRRERKSRSSRHGRDRRGKRRNRHRSGSPQNDNSDQNLPPRRRSDANSQPLGERISKRTREHRSRSRSPNREPDRGRNRERDRSRDNRARHRPDRDELADPQPAPPPQREFKIKDRSKRTDLDVQKELVREENPDMDAHTLEREARNRERMLKEQQRRESLAGPRGGKGESGQGRKRSFAAVYEDEDELKPGRRRKEREGRLGYRHGRDESDEARTSRVENEREALRWT